MHVTLGSKHVSSREFCEDEDERRRFIQRFGYAVSHRIFRVVGLAGSPIVCPRHSMYAIYADQLTPKTTPIDRQSYGSPKRRVWVWSENHGRFVSGSSD